MTQPIGILLILVAGIIGLGAIRYTFIRVMLNTVREANRKNKNQEK